MREVRTLAYKVLKFFDDLTSAVVAVLLMLLAVYAGYALWDNQQVYAAAEEVRASLLELKPSLEGPSFAELRAINPDVCAWVTLDDTGVDYPVVQGRDNLTYVNTDVYGEFSLAGTIFLDSRCASDFSDAYGLLYGHHMVSGQMFGDLENYQDAAFLREHTAGALLLGVPVALLTAVYLAFFCPKGLYRVLKPAVELLAGIPSVVYGFFGIVVLVPAVRALGERWDGSGNAMLTASILLAMMILPTIIGVVEPALRAVPTSYYEGALALGATHERSVYTAVVPAAKSGILAGIVLGVGRAMGETMAVIMVAGNQPRMPKGILQGVRTLTGNIVIEMGYATGLHREALIATGVVLFVFILLINLCFSALKRGKKA